MNAKNSVKTAGRTLDVFEAFQVLRKPVGLSELAAFIKAPMSSCHGLVHTLRNRGYLYSIGSRSTFYPTKRMLEIATVIAAHDPILEQLGPLLAALRDETGETIILGKRQQDAVVYIDVVEGLHTIRYAALPGKLTPLHSSAIGKAMLGQLTSVELEEFAATLSLPKITEHTLTDAGALVADIEEGRGRSYFVTRGENVADVMAVASVVRKGPDHLGIAIAGPVPRVTANFDRYVTCLQAACKSAEREEE
jgi:DNA-binding IclR family transcriptional regulator